MNEEPGRDPGQESNSSRQARNWIDLAIILVLAAAAIWGYINGVLRLGALIIVVAVLAVLV